MSQHVSLRVLWTTLFSLLFAGLPAFAAEEGQSVYGALYNAGHLQAENGGSNQEVVLLYYPEEDGFIGLTTNDSGTEWWTSDALGLNWTVAEDNPLEEYGCRQPGRHSAVMFNNAYYFGANCQDGAIVFKVIGLTEVEAVHIKPLETGETNIGIAANENPGGNPPGGDNGDNPNDQPGDQPGGDDGEQVSDSYPTATVLNDTLYFFFNGGFTQCDADDNCEVVEDATGQPNSVPLEVSEEANGLIYGAFTDGSVLSFDGSMYELIGTVEDVQNLPSIEVYNEDIYVGDMNADGASLYKYNKESEEFDVVTTLDAADQIVNKMQLSDKIDGSQYLAFFTANVEVGTRILAVDPDGNLIQLVDSGLGGENPENNTEVVSIVNRTVTDGDVEKNIMLFGTQNKIDETKVFVLNLGADLAVDLTKNSVVAPPTEDETPTEGDEEVKEGDGEKVTESLAFFAVKKIQKKGKNKGKGKSTLRRGQAINVIVKKSQVHAGDVFSLWINGKEVTSKTAKKATAITLHYKKTNKYKAGSVLTVQVGVQRAYGQGDDQQVSTNVIMSNTQKIKMKK